MLCLISFLSLLAGAFGLAIRYDNSSFNSISFHGAQYEFFDIRTLYKLIFNETLQWIESSENWIYAHDGPERWLNISTDRFDFYRLNEDRIEDRLDYFFYSLPYYDYEGSDWDYDDYDNDYEEYDDYRDPFFGKRDLVSCFENGKTQANSCCRGAYLPSQNSLDCPGRCYACLHNGQMSCLKGNRKIKQSNAINGACYAL